MQYANLKLNDIANVAGISVSFFVQGCPHHCPHCFNPETWDFNGGKEFTTDVLNRILSGLNENGIHRSLCILGGEPLCPENQFLTRLVIEEVKKKNPFTPIYIWTGYIFEELLEQPSAHLKAILEQTDFLIDGPFIQELKDNNLKMRGSSNQRIIDLRNFDFSKNF